MPAPPPQRHSGTNFMFRLMRTNLPPSINVTDEFCAYKHNWQVGKKAHVAKRTRGRGKAHR